MYTAWTSPYETHTMRLSIRPNVLQVTSENIYRSRPAVAVIARPEPVCCRCGWCASKTHKLTHMPERASLPCLHKTIMSKMFLCSLNTWSLQFGEMAAWLSVLEASPDTVLSSRLPTVSAHTLQLCEPTVLHSQVWVGAGESHFSYCSPAKDQRQNHCVLQTAGSRQDIGDGSQRKDITFEVH